MKRARLLAAALALAGCSEGSITAIDIELVPNVSLNCGDQVAAKLDVLLLVVDSPDGLGYGPGDAVTVDHVQIRNVDADPDLELVATVALPDGRLPRIRLEQGAIPDVPLDIELGGLPAPAAGCTPAPAARGYAALGERITGVRFERGAVTALQVPFNLVPECLPPRIVDWAPFDGQRADCPVGEVTVTFSRPIDPASVTPESFYVTPGEPPLPDDIEVLPGGLGARLEPRGLPGVGAALTISVTTAVRDLDGDALDQSCFQGLQPFEESVTVSCGPKTGIPPCDAGGPTGACPRAGLGCVDGVCVPVSCDAFFCAAPYLCDPTVLACVVDCRLYGGDGGCPAARPTCDEATGLCR